MTPDELKKEIDSMWNKIYRQLRYLKDAGVKSTDIDRAFSSAYFKDCENKNNLIYMDNGKN